MTIFIWAEGIGYKYFTNVFYVFIVAVGNVFVMALEALFVGIQVLRLEFYEIFSRFFDANGVPFAPLRISLDPAADKAE